MGPIVHLSASPSNLLNENTIIYFKKTKQSCYYLMKTYVLYYLNLFFVKECLFSYLCWLSTFVFKCQRPNIFSLVRPTREIVHQYVVYRNEDLRSLLFFTLIFNKEKHMMDTHNVVSSTLYNGLLTCNI